ncbi:hypothetical protein GUJ93_ZPchr0006g45498 [Zizania palustris]|uniref:Uncharacterized protein n=1 Tax=Zizania palustris TaxID=103762 RepID=A0A8J5VWH2_ZIZPA|nr:hypothetical protein GUJ93_ZPchr0006g45498 [Zizania palustris]
MKPGPHVSIKEASPRVDEPRGQSPRLVDEARISPAHLDRRRLTFPLSALARTRFLPRWSMLVSLSTRWVRAPWHRAGETIHVGGRD